MKINFIIMIPFLLLWWFRASLLPSIEDFEYNVETLRCKILLSVAI